MMATTYGYAVASRGAGGVGDVGATHPDRPECGRTVWRRAATGAEAALSRRIQANPGAGQENFDQTREGA